MTLSDSLALVALCLLATFALFSSIVMWLQSDGDWTPKVVSAIVFALAVMLVAVAARLWEEADGDVRCSACCVEVKHEPAR